MFKPLEWGKASEHDWQCGCVVGFYEVWKEADCALVLLNGVTLVETDTVEEARAWAEDDYRKRMREALVPLEWKHFNSKLFAQPISNLTYIIMPEDNPCSWKMPGEELHFVKSVDDAKNECEADYYRRLGL